MYCLLIIKFNCVINFNLNIIECGIFFFIIMNGISGIIFYVCLLFILLFFIDFELSFIGVVFIMIFIMYV